MKCKGINSKLIFYVENDLPIKEKLEMDKHFSACESCSESLSFLEKAMGSIEEEKSIEMNPYFVSKTVSRLKESEKNEIQFEFARILKPVLIMVLFIVAIGSGVFMGSNFVVGTEKLQHSDLIDPYFNEIENETIELFFLNTDDHE